MIDIIVVGTGMYTIGRNTDGFGTIVPAINEWAKTSGTNVVVHLVGSHGKNNSEIREKITAFRKLTTSELEFVLYPQDDVEDKKAYVKVMSSVVNPAACVIAVPDHLHYEVTVEAIENKIPSLVVKPLTPTYKESLALSQLAKKNDTYGCVEFHKRFDLANRMFRDSYQKGEIGQPLYSIVEYSQQVSIPSQVFRGWVETTNIFQYLGVHYVDIIRFVTGATPLRVSAIGQKKCLKGMGIDTYDSIQCTVEWGLPGEKQVFAQTLLVNWIDPKSSPAMSNQRIKMIGTKGRYESDQTNRGVAVYSGDSMYNTPNPYFCVPYGTEEGSISWEGYGIESVSTFLNDCVHLANGETSLDKLNGSRSTFEESLVSSVVVEACNKSLELSGEWIVIDEILEGV
ncbi:gfo/Idh/MocA family oxidoreductase [Marinomonas piezotolerans]|uniref:Gfo/Idh/MocA family oxidoreductase n=1 Tax=Marinomonas piezotolerans TaxID=2213058 RepID=A0A370U8D6_9GAMM|nr:Gfo/Idh/MocA family oxidoreductase [Marinomonas piezotolerans]RDL44037.1 gfo/Idh/MocA family oxidoreductase [Marinomonas piezotolerans]